MQSCPTRGWSTCYPVGLLTNTFPAIASLSHWYKSMDPIPLLLEEEVNQHEASCSLSVTSECLCTVLCVPGMGGWCLILNWTLQICCVVISETEWGHQAAFEEWAMNLVLPLRNRHLASCKNIINNFWKHKYSPHTCEKAQSFMWVMERLCIFGRGNQIPGLEYKRGCLFHKPQGTMLEITIPKGEVRKIQTLECWWKKEVLKLIIKY